MKMKPDIPQWLLKQEKLTASQWRQRKRAELKEAIRALDALRMGCVYTPKVEGVYIGTLCDNLEKLKWAWSQKEWGK